MGVDTVFGLPGDGINGLMEGFTTSFLRGQPRRAAIASTLFRDKLRELRDP